MSIPRVRVPIKLDKERTLVMSMNVMCTAEEVLGFGLMNEVRFEEFKVVRALLWAGLLHEMPKLSLGEAGDLADNCVGGWKYVGDKVAEALDAAQPGPDEVPDDEEGDTEAGDPFPSSIDS